ncbi:MAG: CpsD/CapB family tyrosine-protein kinase [Chloroflexi bacterium]|jgi:capsular exopolysaccharide synthesis family protein|nr:CpsD/CapB family tyrosine-protein kinase [Chloroflexota bacterium]
MITDGSVQLETVVHPRSPVSEAYRTLRTNIQFYSLDRPVQTLLVTSASPEDGKSTTVANLAVTFAETGREVLAVDCDLRRPSLHRLFGVSNESGLTVLIREGKALDEVVVPTSVPHLRLLPSGPLPPNPAELLGSQRMERIIESLRGAAEVVLFDSPPTIAATDAAVLAAKVDGVLLVVSVGRTKRDHVVRAKQLLAMVNAKVLGVVLNNVKFDGSLYRYYG